MMASHGVHVGNHIVRNGKRARGYPHVALAQPADEHDEARLRTSGPMKKQEKPVLPTQERIAKYLAAVPPAISGAGGHNQTFYVACSLYNGWNLSEDQTLAWLKIYNQRCKPKWNEKELAHKAASAARVAHDKPRGHLIGQRQRALAKQTRQLTETPIATGQISATLATLKYHLPSSYREVYTHSVFPIPRKESEINVANVAKTPKTTDATAKTESETPQMADPSLARGDQATPEQPDTERIALFLEEVIIHEDGALCSFHYLFDRYRKWRASYGLLATQFDQAQFAAEMQFHGVSTNFERKLFLGIYALFETKDQDAQSTEQDSPVSC
jgi:hypothetical protein